MTGQRNVNPSTATLTDAVLVAARADLARAAELDPETVALLARLANAADQLASHLA